MNSNTSLQAFTPMSQVRSRNEVLQCLLPKSFGIISEKGQSLEDFPGCAARRKTHIVRLSLGCGSHCVERVLAAEISNHESIFRPRNRFAELRRSELLPFLERSRRLNELASGSVGGCGDGSCSDAIVSFRDVSAGRVSGLKISSFTDMKVLEDETLRLLARIALSDVGPDSRNGRLWNAFDWSR
jgi:hypothetical protein